MIRVYKIYYPLLACCGLIGWVSLIGCGAQQPLPAADLSAADFPAAGLPNYQALVSVNWLKALLDHHTDPPNHPRPATYQGEGDACGEGYVIVEASWAELDQADDYQSGHIPRSIHVNTDLFENGYPQWRLKSPAHLQAAIGDLGISPGTTVIVYSHKLIAAARVWWILKYAGVRDVRILDGDARTWQAAGYSLEKKINQLAAVDFSGPVLEQWNLDTATLRTWVDGAGSGGQSIQGNEGLILADVRARPEFVGTISGYDYLDACGRIPHSVWWGDADDASHLYKRADGRLRAPAEVISEWKANRWWPGDSETNRHSTVVFYCGGGWRSSVAFFYAWLSGAKNIRNYSDGWSGWSTQYQADPSANGNTPGWKQIPTDNPRQRGEPTSPPIAK